MNTITRLVEVTEDKHYVIPVITLKKEHTAKGYVAVNHIGIDHEVGTACFCGQHHKQLDKTVWESPSREDAPNITCKSCIRTLRNIMCKSASPYKVIMEKLQQKAKSAEFHVVKHNTSSSSRSEPSAPEAVDRKLPLEVEPVIPIYDTDIHVLPGFDRVLTSNMVLRAVNTSGNVGLVHTMTMTTPKPSIRNGGTINHEGRPMRACGYTHHVTYTEVSLEDAPTITCPDCVKQQIKRKLECEPKRDKSLSMRKRMILAEEKRLAKAFATYGDSIYNNHGSAIMKSYKQDISNLNNMKRGLLFVS